MREILFRGKRIDNGEWVKGFYVCVLDTHYIMTGKFDSLTNGIINSEAYKVDPAPSVSSPGWKISSEQRIFEEWSLTTSVLNISWSSIATTRSLGANLMVGTLKSAILQADVK